MSDKFTLGVGLAHELEMAMNRNEGWNGQLVKKLCEGNNLSVVRHLLLTASALTNASDVVSAVLPDGVNPKTSMEIWDRPNRTFTFVRPAVLTAVEVHELLRYFSGENFRAMSLLLITGKNETFVQEHGPSSDETTPYLYRRQINKTLKKVKVSGKQFFLAGHKTGGNSSEHQLWEIEPTRQKEEKDSASVPAHLGYTT